MSRTYRPGSTRMPSPFLALNALSLDSDLPVERALPRAFRGQSPIMDAQPLLKTSVAVGLTFPLAIPVYRRRFWNKLTTDQQELLRRRRRQSKSSRIVGGVTAGVIIVLGTGNSIGAAPFWALIVAWAFTWPFAAASYAHWSLALLRKDPKGWLGVMTGHQRADTKSVIGHAAVALLPGALFLATFHA